MSFSSVYSMSPPSTWWRPSLLYLFLSWEGSQKGVYCQTAECLQTVDEAKSRQKNLKSQSEKNVRNSVNILVTAVNCNWYRNMKCLLVHLLHFWLAIYEYIHIYLFAMERTSCVSDSQWLLRLLIFRIIYIFLCIWNKLQWLKRHLGSSLLFFFLLLSPSLIAHSRQNPRDPAKTRSLISQTNLKTKS